MLHVTDSEFELQTENFCMYKAPLKGNMHLKNVYKAKIACAHSAIDTQG